MAWLFEPRWGVEFHERRKGLGEKGRYSQAADAASGGYRCGAGKPGAGRNAAELQTLFAANRRLFKPYVLREQLDRLWTYKKRPGVLNFLLGRIKALRWQRLLGMERLGDVLFRHLEASPGIAIIRSPSVSSRSTRPSKLCSAEHAECAMNRCCS